MFRIKLIVLVSFLNPHCDLNRCRKIKKIKEKKRKKVEGGEVALPPLPDTKSNSSFKKQLQYDAFPPTKQRNI